MLWSLTQVAAEGGRPRKKLSMAKCSIRSRTLLKSLKYLSVASPALRCHFSIGSLSVGLRSHHRLRLSDELNPSLLSSLLFTLEYLFLSSLCMHLRPLRLRCSLQGRLQVLEPLVLRYVVVFHYILKEGEEPLRVLLICPLRQVQIDFHCCISG